MNTLTLDNVESLKLMLIARATGYEIKNEAYIKLREALITQSDIQNKLPRFVRLCNTISEFWLFIKPMFPTYAERSKYIIQQFTPVVTFLENQSISPSDAGISDVVRNIDSEYIQEAWNKALERRVTDPEGAITAARTLLESVCKHILDFSKIGYKGGEDLPKLYGLTAHFLHLSPSQHTELLFKQILGGCHAVVEGLGALRNRHGDAHGKGLLGVKPAPRHAELAVNLAGATAKFLLETYVAIKK